MSVSENLSGQARELLGDSRWLASRVDALYDELATLTKQTPPDAKFVDDLLILFPQVSSYGNVRKWTKLLSDTATNLFQELSQTPKKNLTYHFLVSHPREKVTANIAVSLKRARKRLLPVNLVDSYLTLFKNQVYRGVSETSPLLVESAIRTVRQVNVPQMQCNLYLTLAFTHLLWGDYPTSIKQADLAYRHAQHLQADYESGLAAHVLGKAYKASEQSDMAIFWQEKAECLFERSESFKELFLIQYERGIAAYTKKAFTTAQENFENALTHAGKQDDLELVELAREAAAIASIESGNIDTAKQALMQSLHFWQSQGQPLRIAHIYTNLGYLSSRSGENDLQAEYIANAKNALNDTDTAQDSTSHGSIEALRTFINKHGGEKPILDA